MTAVEWFNQQLVDRQNGNGDSRSRDEIFEQAKSIEKAQIEYAFYQRDLDEFGDEIEFEQYYNEKFKPE